MNVFNSILQAALKKALYGCAASLAAFLYGLPAFQGAPQDVQSQLLWSALIVPAVTGAAGAIARAVGYKPSLDGR